MRGLNSVEWEPVLLEIMKIERRYAYDKRNMKSQRRSEIRELIEKVSAEQLETDASK